MATTTSPSSSLHLVFVLVLAVVLTSLGQSDGKLVKILPPGSPFFVLEGSPIKLTCRAGAKPGTPLQWTVQGIPVEDFGFTQLSQESTEDGYPVIQTVLLKEKATASDIMTSPFLCTLGNKDDESREIHVLSVFTEDKNLSRDDSTSIKCDPGLTRTSFTLTWHKNDVSVEELPALTGRYQLSDGNTTLTILNAENRDTGEYECHIRIKLGISEQSFRLPVWIKGKPFFTSGGAHPSYVVFLNGTIDLLCPASGAPPPDVMWLRGDSILNPGGRVQVLPEGQGSRLKVSNLRPSDAGIYMCVAENANGIVRRDYNVTFLDMPANANAASRLMTSLDVTSMMTLTAGVTVVTVMSLLGGTTS